MRILCIEDNATLATIVKNGLHSACFAVDHFVTIEDGVKAIANIHYDAVVLDLNLPDIDGLTSLERLRAARGVVPILFLSARNKAAEPFVGRKAATDDYLPKPFKVDELVARVRALLRLPEMVPVELACGNLTYRPDTHIAVVTGREYALPRREATLFEYLLRNMGQPVSKPMIEDRLYAFGEEVASNAVEVHIHYLRKRLAAMEADVSIATIRRTGYVLSVGSTGKAAQQPKATDMCSQPD